MKLKFLTFGKFLEMLGIYLSFLVPRLLVVRFSVSYGDTLINASGRLLILTAEFVTLK